MKSSFFRNPLDSESDSSRDSSARNSVATSTSPSVERGGKRSKADKSNQEAAIRGEDVVSSDGEEREDSEESEDSKEYEEDVEDEEDDEDDEEKSGEDAANIDRNGRRESRTEWENKTSASKSFGSSSQANSVAGPLTRLTPSNGASTQSPKDLLLLSLVEARSRTLAASEINATRLVPLSEDHATVRNFARPIFAKLVEELHQSGLLPRELSHTNTERSRIQYLAAFDSVVRNEVAATIARKNYDHSELGSLNDWDPFERSGNHPSSHHHNSSSRSRSSSNPGYDNSKALIIRPENKMSLIKVTSDDDILAALLSDCTIDNPASVAPFMNPSDRLEPVELGHGAFAKVVVVRNTIDGGSAAFKLQELSQDAIKKIISLSEVEQKAELDSLFKEPRVMSKLNGIPHVVSYRGTGYYRTTRQAFDQMMAIDPLQVPAIKPRALAVSYPAPKRGQLLQLAEKPEDMSGATSVSTEKYDPHARTDVLWMAMEKYTMTLRDFIKGSAHPISHCFHTEIAVDILMAISEGLRHMHRRKVIHMDLKPENIFLSVRKAKYGDRHSAKMHKEEVILSTCATCERGYENDDDCDLLMIHIGDFGLSVDISNSELSSDVSLSDGTEQYQPFQTTEICAKRDVYALGIIAFELIASFGTTHERVGAINLLRKEKYDRLQQLQDSELGGLIKKMVVEDSGSRWDSDTVYRELNKLRVRMDYKD